jgi:hypothetical protein
MIAGCGSTPKPPGNLPPAVWRSVGTWSGRGNAQTDSFEIGYEQCRIRWEMRDETVPGAAKLRVTVNSAVSGRDLAVVVDHQGVGHDVAYVSVDPHYSYLVIESSNVFWSVTVEELQ